MADDATTSAASASDSAADPCTSTQEQRQQQQEGGSSETNPPASTSATTAITAVSGPLSPTAARSARAVPFLTGNPHTAHQRAGTLLLHEAVDLRPVLYSDDEGEEGEGGEPGREGEYYGAGLGGGVDGLGELAAYLPRPDAGEEGDGPGGSGKGKARARKPPVSLPPLPAGRGCHLVILAVPPHMVPGELLQFVSPFREEIRLMRIVRHQLPPEPPSALGFSLSNSSSLLGRGGVGGGSLFGSGGGLLGGGGGGPDSRPAKYMALVEMRSQEAADALYQAFQGKPFNSLEPWLRCRLGFLQGISFAVNGGGSGGSSRGAGGVERSLQQQHAALVMDIEMGPSSTSSQQKASSSSSSSAALAAAAAAGESPQCVVCLDALDGLQHPPSPRKCAGGGKGGKGKVSAASAAASVAAAAAEQVLVTACNHAFHMDCLRRLAGPLCPVCRYNHDTVAYHSSICGECGRTTDLWVCLVCGFIGCGRYHAQHSRKHYLETLHAYAIEVQTQQVWDYVGDGYVHRLLYHKGEGHGKLVEVADPRASSRSDGQSRPRTAPPSDGEEEEMMHRKLESWAQQYTVLLSSGLEEQRRRFEARLAELHAAYAPPPDAKGKKKPAVALTGEQVVAALKQERRQLEHRCLAARERLRKVTDETSFLQELNGTLEQNQAQLELQMREAEGELTALATERQEQVPALERRVQELMARLDSSSASASSSAGEAAVAAGPKPAAGGGGLGVEEAKKDGTGGGGAGARAGPAPPPPPPAEGKAGAK